MIKYKLNDIGIFYVTFSGDVSADDIHNYLLEFDKIDDLPKNILLIYNMHNATLHGILPQVLSLAKLAKKVTVPYNSVRTAFVVNKPQETVYSILFTQQLAPKNSIRKVFSTENAAISWLKQS